MSASIVSVDEDSLRKDIKNLVRETVEEALNAPPDKEASELVGAERYERTAGRDACHSGRPARKLVTSAGKVEARGMHANRLLLIHCMFTVRESDIVDNTVVITRRMINEFRCADGQIGSVRYDYFERLLKRKIDSGVTRGLRLLARQFDANCYVEQRTIATHSKN